MSARWYGPAPDEHPRHARRWTDPLPDGGVPCACGCGLVDYTGSIQPGETLEHFDDGEDPRAEALAANQRMEIGHG